MITFPEPWIVDVQNVTPEDGDVLLLGCDREYGLCLVDGELHWWRIETMKVRTSLALYSRWDLVEGEAISSEPAESATEETP